MASRLQVGRALLQEFESALASFQASKSSFRVLKTVYPRSQSEISIREPATIEPGSNASPRTLFILDSSFNPPSTAHRRLALSALSRASSAKQQGPHRLLLLFAVLNADKGSGAPAASSERLVMMTLFAQDLLSTIVNPRQDSKSGDSGDREESDYVPTPIDIGITKAPYYTDKSIAIAESDAESGRSPFYPDFPQHVHLIGFDTVTRFFNPKYYTSFDPPLSALNPYFDTGHELRVFLRPDDASEDEAVQRAWLKQIEDGELEAKGGKKEWASQIELVSPSNTLGVSSTRIRGAASTGQWNIVESLCSDGVAAWLKERSLYSSKKTVA